MCCMCVFVYKMIKVQQKIIIIVKRGKGDETALEFDYVVRCNEGIKKNVSGSGKMDSNNRITVVGGRMF